MKPNQHSHLVMFLLATLIAVAILTGAANAAEHGYRTIYRFQGGSDGWTPIGLPAVDKNGDLYGATADGVAYHGGTIYKLTAPQTHSGTWTKTLLHTFPSGNGGYAVSVVIGPDGALYGFAFGPQTCGFVWQLTRAGAADGAWRYAVLYAFTGTSDGCGPQGNPVFDAEGNLYGAAQLGGELCVSYARCGTVFELKRSATKRGKWHFTVLHTFTGDPDGMEPFAGVTLDQQGNVYGTTNYGGTYGWGAVYRVAPPKTKGGAWRETVLYSLDSGMDMGANPSGPVIFDSSGNIYGTAAFGGDLNCQGGHGCGTLFELTPPTAENAAWTSTTLYNFQGGSDGVLPEGYMVFDRQGNLYSTTYLGGTGQGGTAFRLNPSALQGRSWTETLLHWFPENKKDGYDPVEGLTWGKWGDLYGVAWVGGDPSCSQDGCGTVFEIWP